LNVIYEEAADALNLLEAHGCPVDIDEVCEKESVYDESISTIKMANDVNRIRKNNDYTDRYRISDWDLFDEPLYCNFGDNETWTWIMNH
jgi:hypothetical protein